MSKQSKDRPKTFPTSSTPKESSPKPPTERSKFQLQIWSVVLATLVGLLSVIVSYMGLSHKVENVQTKVNEVGNLHCAIIAPEPARDGSSDGYRPA